MSARGDILSAIRARPFGMAEPPPADDASPIVDAIGTFAERARLANAEVHFVGNEEDVPQAIAELLRGRNLPAIVHVPPNASQLPWESAPGLTLEATPPGANEVAVAIAPFAIAETGTLAYPARADAPASWHFRTGFEIAILRAGTILPRMEEVIGRLKANGLPSTVNFVTGPSRTGDIEQTLELGAHGPKALAILIVKGRSNQL